MHGHEALLRAARQLREADGLLVTAGAGMGVDSGLPDFRGAKGFWRAYPALGRARISFSEIASPQAFMENPGLAWGFYGHRLALYRATVPHAGFHILLEMAENMAHGAFVFTSNVDGQFQKAGFDAKRIIECHGSIHHLQCLENCEENIWPADAVHPEIDPQTCRLRSPLPQCLVCRSLARPNILMFGDWGWQETRLVEQTRHFERWRRKVRRLAIIEIGAGTAIPSVRHFGEEEAAPLIRINPRQWQVRQPSDVGLAMGGLEGLRAIQTVLRESPA
jgi:NAD-dependent SIR2 family protein deacetylase